MNDNDRYTGSSAKSPASLSHHPLTTAFALTDELADVLLRHGITLPSLAADLASCTVTTAPRPLIQLGRVNMETARLLIAVLRNAIPEQR